MLGVQKYGSSKERSGIKRVASKDIMQRGARRLSPVHSSGLKRCHVCFVQYFWFRHIFLLSEDDRRAIQAMTVQLLADKKLEVQDLAKSTLAGLIKVWPLNPSIPSPSRLSFCGMHICMGVCRSACLALMAKGCPSGH
jgi:hypothetical protein